LDAENQVVLAVIAVLATSVAGLVYVVKAYGEAKQVNSAVNHKDTGELSLYRLAHANSEKLDEVIAKQAEFDRKWGNLPPQIGDAVGLFGVLHDMGSQLDEVQAELRQHVAWEMSQKYPKGDA
jgi:hypothetical protein